MEYGSPFNKPNIKSTTIPGGWTPLNNKSKFIISGVEYTLEYLVKTLNYQLPANVKLQLFTSAAQIVSGVNIYLEFRIDDLLDVQVIVNESVHFSHDNESHLSIDRVYVTNKKLFK